MLLKKRHQGLAGWIAVLCFFFALLAPSLASAWGQQTGSSSRQIEVCTSLGSKWVIVEDKVWQNKKPASHTLLGLLDHCPCCQFSTTAQALPPEHTLSLPASPRLAFISLGEKPRLYVQVEHYPPAQPRAPPIAL